MSKKRILIATPAKNGVPSYYFDSYNRVLGLRLPQFDIEFAVESAQNAINLSRNVLAQHAIDCGYDKMVQIDSDHPWQVEHLLRILEHNEPIVGGMYCKKIPGPPVWLAIRSKGANRREDGLLQVDYIGTGFLAIDTSVLIAMREKFPEREFIHSEDTGIRTARTMTEWYPIGVVGPNTAEGKLARIRQLTANWGGDHAGLVAAIDAVLADKSRGGGRLLGEDYFFCHLARKCGYQIFADTRCVVPHDGHVAFPITPDKVATATDIPMEEGDISAW